MSDNPSTGGRAAAVSWDDPFGGPINHRSPAVAPLLTALQGNIMREHGRRRAAHLLFVVRKGAAGAAREWIRTRAAGLVTSAAGQLRDDDAARASPGAPRGLFASFLLSAAGYTALGIPEALLPRDPRFRAGMKASRDYLFDPPLDRWEEPYRGELHGMLMLAHDDEAVLREEVALREGELGVFAEMRVIERGAVLLNEYGEHAEHFGFVEGVSQPLMLDEDVARERDQRDGISVWDPSASPHLVLDREPAPGGAVRYGSYLVFRKLEQDVRAFREMERSLAEALGLPSGESERAGALIVGRFRDGTPLTSAFAPGTHSPVPNNFDYASDLEGVKCPFNAHIRKLNPRGDEARNSPQRGRDLQIMAQERSHRIARRGIPYGEQRVKPGEERSPDELPEGGVGLLFMCYQRDITEQFEHMQGVWANGRSTLRQPFSGTDPVAGQLSGRVTRRDQVWPRRWGSSSAGMVRMDLRDCVRLRGGEYFFAPSIPALAEFPGNAGPRLP
ncbi:MAG TPA: hypothetical protein VF263_22860 [Longimicrobiaceae bacterium]